MKDKLVFNYLKDERRYELITKSGLSVETLVDNFIAQHDVDFPLTCDEDYKLMWSHRTEINNLKKEIEDARKQTTAVVCNPLLNVCKPLEKKLAEVSDKLTQQMLVYKPKEEKPKTTSVIIIELPIDSDEVARVKALLDKEQIAYKEERK